MSENEKPNKNEESGNAEKSAYKLSELQNLSDYISKSGGEKRKKLKDMHSPESEKERAERIERARALMNRNTEEAKRAADERLAKMEYGGEYRQRLAARENKRAEEEAARRAQEEAEAIRSREEARKRAIEEFRRREAEEARKRALDSEKMLSSFDKSKREEPASEKPETEKPAGEPDKTPDITAGAHGQKPEAQYEPIAKAPEKAPKSPTSSNINEKDGRILLNINPAGRTPEKTVRTTDDGYLHIGASSIPTAGAAPYNVNRSVQNMPSDNLYAPIGAPRKAPENYAPNTEEQLRGVEIARGEYQEELRLLRETEALYNEAAYRLREQRQAYNEYNTAPEYPDSEPYRTPSYDLTEEQALYVPIGRKGGKEKGSLSDAQYYGLDDRDIKLYEESLRKKQYTPEPAGYGGNLSVPDYGAPDFNSPDYGAPDYIPPVDDNFDTSDYDFENDEYIAIYAKAELPKALNKYHKKRASLEKELRSVAKEQGTATLQKNALLIIKKIGIQKEITEITIEAVMACIYAKARSAKEKQRRILENNVAIYNGFCDEYEMLVGKPLPKLSKTMADEVAAGQMTAPIPNIYYPSDSEALLLKKEKRVDDLKLAEEANRSYKDSGFDGERAIERIIAAEDLQFETESEAEIRGREAAEKTGAVKRAIERDILLIGLRNEHRLTEYETKRDMIVHSFGTDRSGRDARISEYDKLLAKEKGLLKKSIKLERDDNSRYYALLLDGGMTMKVRRRARADRLDALKMRLEVLLSEREELNESLIALYGGSGKKAASAKLNRKAAAVRRKYAKITYRRQKSLARTIEKTKAPLDMKEKAYALLNKKTESIATIEENTYKLKKLKPRGAAKRELIADIKRSKTAIRRADSDLKFLMKRMKKREQHYIADRNWAILWIVILILIGAGAAVWLQYGDLIAAYFSAFFGK